MKKLTLLCLLIFTLETTAQEARLNDANFINWIQSVNTLGLSKKWSLHLEYQMRRTDGLKNGQQNLLRLGANYQLQENVTAHAGYAYVATFPYGDFPIASSGTFPEQRLYEQITLRQNLNNWSFAHRFRLEQRWLGKIKPASNAELEGWVFLNRFRYQFRLQRSLLKIKDKQVYAVLADEIFIGAGKNLGTNIFDQNRLILQLGLKFSKHLSMEFGYLNQILQQGKRINEQSVIQRNEGFLLSSSLNF